ncbi:hypothetical protein CNMCM5623_002500 [Aspergillus felis]|uniref:MYND-type domain-containing protein n=1 Tax=Aspergillus felis TaxID=1287682 RepID=A0A8H6QCL4_9EURO|nr:hypothetical protein CNMCM5623_002500 [Aspergillus felis]
MDASNDTEYLETALNLADIMMRKRNYRRADSILTEILVQITKKLASESTTDSDQGGLSQYDKDLICNCFRTMANNARKQGNLDRAKEYMNIGMRFVKTQLVPDTVLIPVFLLDLCKIYQEEGDLRESERIVKEALAESERILGPSHPLSLDIREVLVQVLVEGDNYEVAESSHRQLLQLNMEGWGEKHPRTLICLSNFSATLQSMNKLEEAEECARLAFEGLQDVVDWGHKWLRVAAENLATAYGHNMKTNEAEKLLKEVLHHLKQDPYTQDSSILIRLLNLAQVYTSQKRPELAEATYKEAIEEKGQNNLKAKAEETMPITYRVACGDPRSEQDFLYVELPETAPAFLGETIDQKAEERFLQFLVDRHHMSFLNKRSWRCVTCNSPASDMLHQTAALLRPGLGAAPNFTPSMVDFVIPICEPDTECDRQADQLALQCLKEALPLQLTSETQCMQCSAELNLKRCSSCKIARFCSTECQALAWPSHKSFCKRVRRQRQKGRIDISSCTVDGWLRFKKARSDDGEISDGNSGPVYQDKVAVQKYLQEKSKESGGKFSYTIQINGPFLDWGLMVNFLLNLEGPEAELYDGGDRKFSTTTLSGVGKGVCGIINNLEATKNRTVYIREADVSQKQLLKISGKQRATKSISTVELEKAGFAELSKPNPDPEVFVFNFLRRAIFGEGFGNLFTTESLSNDLLGVEPIGEEELKNLVAKYTN